MRYEVCFQGRIVSSSGAAPLERDEIESLVDAAVEELEKLGAEDIDVSTDLGKASLIVSVTVEDEDLLGAQVVGNSKMRSAFHAAGAGTPGWSIDWTEARTVPETDDHPELELLEA